MFHDNIEQQFIIDHSAQTPTLLRNRQGELIAQERLVDGVFGGWTRTLFIHNRQVEPGQPQFEIYSYALTNSYFAELNQLPIHPFGLKFCHPAFGTWWLAAYLPNPDGPPCNHFHNAPKQTGV